MAKQRNSSEPQPEAENVPGGTPPDPLADYKSAITDLSAAQEKLGTLQSLHADLEGQLARAELDHESALTLASQADELDSQEADELVRIGTRVELLRRKVLDVAHRLEVAEGERHERQTHVAARFSTAWRTFLWWITEKEVGRIKEGLAAPCGAELLQAVALCSRAVVETRKLELTGSENAEVLLAGAGKLLAALEREPGFQLPPWQPTAAPGVSATASDNVGLPWLDRGMTQRQIEEEFLRIRIAEPALDVTGTYSRMRELHPELFKGPSPTDINLSQEPEPKSAWRAEMIGDTVPA